MQVLHERFAPDPDVAVLGVHLDDRGDPTGYLAKHGYTFPTMANGPDIASLYSTKGIPTFVVIAPDRRIVYKHTGLMTDAVRDTIERKARNARANRG